MKKLKRRLSAAFRSGSNNNVSIGSSGGGSYYDSECDTRSMVIGYGMMSAPVHNRCWTPLSESMSHLSDKLAVDGTIMEECIDPATLLRVSRGGTAGRRYDTNVNYLGGMHHHPSAPPSSTQSSHHYQPPPRTHSLYYPRGYSGGGRNSYYGSNASVVQESMILGSDGESVEVSPCTSDQTPPTGVTVPPRYIVNVKMRQKPARKWSEEEIQKRLSLPADLRLPQAVVDKMNRTPTLDQPLTRKNRRASLSEIGFGKLETYEKLEKLGEGTYATVFRGRSILTNQCVALKEIRLEQEEGAPCTAIREVSLLRNLRHANVVTLHDIVYTNNMLTLVFEYVDRDLKQYMDSCNNSMHMSNIRLFLYQLLRGLAYCHQRRVLHRDLKPQNLLITAKGELKLADFGLARAKSVPTKTYSNEVVTLWYRPPDVLLGSTDYSTHIDMWGVGCILFEMIAGRALFPGGTSDEQLGLIFRTLGSPRPDRHPTICEKPAFYPFAGRQYQPEPLCRQIPRIDAYGFELLMKFLQYEGRDRISAQDALKHQFLKTIAVKCSHLRDEQSIMESDGIHVERETLSHHDSLHHHHHSRRRAAAGKDTKMCRSMHI